MANWDKLGTSGKVEDRRGLSSAGMGLGVGGVILAILGAMVLNHFGVNVSPSTLIQTVNQFGLNNSTQVDPSEQPVEFRGLDDYEKFVSTVVGSTDQMWSGVFSENNMSYIKPKLVLFRQVTNSGCGIASSQVGPHYCPSDKTIYIDETFFDELATRYGGSKAESAQAYVIAHEVGHHVQNEFGILTKYDQADNQTSIAIELQADCYAGLWARSIEKLGVINQGDISEIQQSVAAVGDDRIQEKSPGGVQPESWTHGSSQQRLKAFETGFTTGKVTACDIE